MKNFKKILLVQTTDREIASRAAHLATASRGRLTIMEVIPQLPRRDRKYKLADGRSIQAALRNDAEEQIRRLATELKNENVNVAIKVAVGIPSIEIIKEVIRSQIDLVMIEAEGSRSTKAPLFGSLSMHLFRKCPCAVWGINSKRRKHNHCLAAVDPSPEPGAAEELNGTVVGVAHALSDAYGLRLSVLGVWQSLWDTWGGRAGFTRSEIVQKIKEEQEEVRDYLLKMLAANHLAPDGYEVHLRRGSPKLRINEFAARKNVDLIVMGTVCRTGIPGFLIGNTAESVLQHVRCSVLTLKPTGFSSPVTL